MFVNIGLLTSEDSIEKPDSPLANELTYTYLSHEKKTHAHMGRGWWLMYNPPYNRLALESLFSEGRFTWQIPPEQIEQALADKDLGEGGGSGNEFDDDVKESSIESDHGEEDNNAN